MKKLIIINMLCALLFTLASPVQAQTYSKITYVHSDADGTPFAATDEQGDIEWQIDHYPYGDEYANTQVVRKSDVSFAGKPYDEEIGLSYFGALWYDPAIGRFTGVDPIPVNPNDYRTFNRYAYGFNNPYKYNDPDGRYAEIIFEAGSLAVGFDSLINNLSAGNYSSAAVDAGGIVVDGIGVLIPGAPGVAGLGIKASREAGEAVTKNIPDKIYRQGRSNDSAIKDIRVDADGASFRDSLSNTLPSDGPAVLKPGKPFIAVDTGKLPRGSVVVDNIPPGHVSVKATAEQIVKAIDKSSSGKFPKN